MTGRLICRFDEVRLGDEVYLREHYDRSNPYMRVSAIGRLYGSVELYLGAAAHPTTDTRTRMVGHPWQAVAVRRRIG